MPTLASSPRLSPGEAVAQRTITSYTLTPEQLRKSEGLHRTGVLLSLTSTVFGIVILFVLIRLRFGPRIERFAVSLTRKRLMQAAIFVPALLITLSLIEFPLEVYGHHVSLAYGLSVQRWGSWLGDWIKGELLTLIFATFTLCGLYALIRKSPRHWWLFAWVGALLIMAGMVFAAPVIIDPIFNRFEPLSRTNPELTTQLQNLARSAGLDIPESRIFLMHASEKVTTYNAYVTGFGATKRIVVWDTTARDLTLPQTLFIFGHETGHYVMHHIYMGMAFAAVLMFVGFWLIQRIAQHVLHRHGRTLAVDSMGSWSSLPILMLVASVLSFFGEPLGNSFSRWEEHNADVYGLEITTPVTKDARQVAAQAFQVLGEKSYSYPNPSPLLVFWSYSHPPVADRIRFALSGERPRASSPSSKHTARQMYFSGQRFTGNR